MTRTSPRWGQRAALSDGARACSHSPSCGLRAAAVPHDAKVACGTAAVCTTGRVALQTAPFTRPEGWPCKRLPFTRPEGWPCKRDSVVARARQRRVLWVKILKKKGKKKDVRFPTIRPRVKSKGNPLQLFPPQSRNEQRSAQLRGKVRPTSKHAPHHPPCSEL